MYGFEADTFNLYKYMYDFDIFIIILFIIYGNSLEKLYGNEFESNISYIFYDYLTWISNDSIKEKKGAIRV